MSYGKYIVLNETSIIIFDPAQSHKDVASGFKAPPTSAGFIRTSVHNDEVRVQCYGKSRTLDLESNPPLDETLARFAIGKI